MELEPLPEAELPEPELPEAELPEAELPEAVPAGQEPALELPEPLLDPVGGAETGLVLGRLSTATAATADRREDAASAGSCPVTSCVKM